MEMKNRTDIWNLLVPNTTLRKKIKMREITAENSTEDILESMFSVYGELKVKDTQKLSIFLGTKKSLDHIDQRILNASINLVESINEKIWWLEKKLLLDKVSKSRPTKYLKIDTNTNGNTKEQILIQRAHDEKELIKLIPETYTEYKVKKIFNSSTELIEMIKQKNKEFTSSKEGRKLNQAINGIIKHTLYEEYYEHLKKEWKMTDEMYKKCKEINGGA